MKTGNDTSGSSASLPQHLWMVTVLRERVSGLPSILWSKPCKFSLQDKAMKSSKENIETVIDPHGNFLPDKSAIC